MTIPDKQTAFKSALENIENIHKCDPENTNSIESLCKLILQDWKRITTKLIIWVVSIGEEEHLKLVEKAIINLVDLYQKNLYPA